MAGQMGEPGAHGGSGSASPPPKIPPAQGPGFNSAGYVYISFVGVYTALLLIGLAILCSLRNHTAVRLRDALMTTVAIATIHVYLAAIFIVYPLHSDYTCSEEFWYMSIVFPLAIALFQASNVRLLAVSRQQEDLFWTKRWARFTPSFGVRPAKFKRWYTSLAYHQKTYVWIVVGLVCQVSRNSTGELCLLFPRSDIDRLRSSSSVSSCSTPLAAFTRALAYLGRMLTPQPAVAVSNGRLKLGNTLSYLKPFH